MWYNARSDGPQVSRIAFPKGGRFREGDCLAEKGGRMSVVNDELKQELIKEKIRLLEQVTSLRGNGDRERGGGCGNHMADDATETYEYSKDLSLERNEASLLWLVEHALEKFEQGTFGICESCGTPIDRARLQALPYVLYCMECQARMERRG